MSVAFPHPLRIRYVFRAPTLIAAFKSSSGSASETNVIGARGQHERVWVERHASIHASTSCTPSTSSWTSAEAAAAAVAHAGGPSLRAAAVDALDQRAAARVRHSQARHALATRALQHTVSSAATSLSTLAPTWSRTRTAEGVGAGADDGIDDGRDIVYELAVQVCALTDPCPDP
jgi:hypothetical protein